MMTYEDIVRAQAEWGDAVVAMGRLAGDRQACEAAAASAVDGLYAYEQTTVLFKPTRAAAVPFRETRRGAISYFIGDDDRYAEDSGFALNPWTAVRFDNHVHHIMGNKACAMGHYWFTAPDGSELKVEYSFGYLLAPGGEVRIFLHHSSLPYEAERR